MGRLLETDSEAVIRVNYHFETCPYNGHEYGTNHDNKRYQIILRYNIHVKVINIASMIEAIQDIALLLGETNISEAIVEDISPNEQP